MTTPATEQKCPPATILYRATPFTVFKTLLWAEFAPRRRVLTIALFLQLLLSLHIYTWNLDFESGIYGREPRAPFEGSIEYLALGVIAYCALFQGRDGFSARAPWQSMALPVRRDAQLLVGVAFQILVALLVGALWGLYRHFGNEDTPFLYPVLGMVLLAVQGHAAVLWCAAVGVSTGLAIFSTGLMGAAVCGILLGNIGPFSPNVNTASVLLACGACWCFVAARTASGGLAPVADMGAMPVVTRLYRWHLTRSLHKSPFASPFRAQVWFEWRRSARWIVFASAAIVAGVLLLDTPYMLTREQSLFGKDGVIESSHPSGLIVYLGLPFLFWYAHIAVTGPYRSFVFTRPQTVEGMSAAKLLAAFLAAIPLTIIGESTQWFYRLLLEPKGVADIVAASESAWSVALSLAGATVTIYLTLISGPLLMLIAAPVFMVLFFPLVSTDSTTEGFSIAISPADLAYNTSVVSAVLLLFMLTCGLLRRRFDRKAGSFSWELATACAVMPVCTLIGIAERLTSSSQFGLSTLYVYCPIMTLLAAIRYGIRENLLLPRQRVALLTLLAGTTATMIAGVYPLSNTTVVSGAMAAGYLGSLICCTFVFYPLAIRNQREATLWSGTGRLPQWMLFLVSPLAWLAFHTIGEEISEKGVRS